MKTLAKSEPYEDSEPTPDDLDWGEVDALANPATDTITETMENENPIVDVRTLNIPLLGLYKRYRLLEFDILNLNERIYRKNIIEPLLEGLNARPLYGELDNINWYVEEEKISHRISNIRIEGKYLVGDIAITDTPCGRILETFIDQKVFRSRATGDVNLETHEIESLDIIAFDVVAKDNDGFAMEEETELDEVIYKLREEIK